MMRITEESIKKVGLEETRIRIAGRLLKMAQEAEGTEEDCKMAEMLNNDFNELCDIIGDL